MSETWVLLREWTDGWRVAAEGFENEVHAAEANYLLPSKVRFLTAAASSELVAQARAMPPPGPEDSELPWQPLTPDGEED